MDPTVQQFYDLNGQTCLFLTLANRTLFRRFVWKALAAGKLVSTSKNLMGLPHSDQ